MGRYAAGKLGVGLLLWTGQILAVPFLGTGPTRHNYWPNEKELPTLELLYATLNAHPGSYCESVAVGNANEDRFQSLHETWLPKLEAVLKQSSGARDYIELVFGAKANQLLDKAIEDGDDELLDDIAYLYPYTKASFLAAFLVGYSLRDFGQTRLAELYFLKAQDYAANQEERESLVDHLEDVRKTTAKKLPPPLQEVYSSSQKTRWFDWQMRALRLLGPKRFAELTEADPLLFQTECVIRRLATDTFENPEAFDDYDEDSVLPQHLETYFREVGNRNNRVLSRLVMHRLADIYTPADKNDRLYAQAIELARPNLGTLDGNDALELEKLFRRFAEADQKNPRGKQAFAAALSGAKGIPDSVLPLLIEFLQVENPRSVSIDGSLRESGLRGIYMMQERGKSALPLLLEVLDAELEGGRGSSLYYEPSGICDGEPHNRNVLRRVLLAIGSLDPGSWKIALPQLKSAQARIRTHEESKLLLKMIVAASPNEKEVEEAVYQNALDFGPDSEMELLPLEMQARLIERLAPFLEGTAAQSYRTKVWLGRAKVRSHKVALAISSHYQRLALKLPLQKEMQLRKLRYNSPFDDPESEGKEYGFEDLGQVKYLLHRYFQEADVLLPLLRHESADVRARALRILEVQGAKAKDWESFVAPLLYDADNAVRLEAGLALLSIDFARNHERVFLEFKRLLLSDCERAWMYEIELIGLKYSLQTLQSERARDFFKQLNADPLLPRHRLNVLYNPAFEARMGRKN